MNDLRTAAQQALEALLTYEQYIQPLTNVFGGPRVPEEGSASAKVDAAITGLRAALAEPVQEPVTWRWGYRSVTTGEMDWRGYVEIPSHPNLRSPAIIMQPLYTAPPQRKPLSEEELSKIIDAVIGFNSCWGPEEKFARAIERAHGIGGQQ